LPRSSPTRYLCRPHAIKVLGLLLLGLLPLPVRAESGPIPKWQQKVLECEKRGAWLEACRCCDDVLRKDRDNVAAREAYQRCLRRLHLTARHGDTLYRQTLQKLTPTQALDAYEQVIALLSVAYPDRAKTNLTYLFEQGVQELRLALDTPLFRKHYLPDAKDAAVKAFQERLADWPSRKIETRAEARDQLRALIRSAPRDGLALRPLVFCAFALEFAAGACNALDEYSSFMTPGSLQMTNAAERGKIVGVGLELGVVGDRLQIARVYPRGPAADAGLNKNDRLLRIAGKSVADLPAEAAAGRLLGEPDSAVEVEVEIPGEMPMKRTVKLVRRAVMVPSVEYQPLYSMSESIQAGYMRISYFTDSTLQAVKEALAEAMTRGHRGVIIDLRGNPGGLFMSAVNVAELFLTDGVIVISQSPFKEYNRSFKVESTNPWQVPVVVLIDAETASAAEVLAGALKEGRAGRIPTLVMGQPSYGKGSIQCVIPMEKSPLEHPAAIRLTVAKLFSPANQPYTGRGVSPHEPTMLTGDALLEEAKKELLKLIMLPKPMIMS
jgi:carboxyl-terminal processing protease